MDALPARNAVFPESNRGAEGFQKDKKHAVQSLVEQYERKGLKIFLESCKFTVTRSGGGDLLLTEEGGDLRDDVGFGLATGEPKVRGGVPAGGIHVNNEDWEIR